MCLCAYLCVCLPPPTLPVSIYVCMYVCVRVVWRVRCFVLCVCVRMCMLVCVCGHVPIYYVSVCLPPPTLPFPLSMCVCVRVAWRVACFLLCMCVCVFVRAFLCRVCTCAMTRDAIVLVTAHSLCTAALPRDAQRGGWVPKGRLAQVTKILIRVAGWLWVNRAVVTPRSRQSSGEFIRWFGIAVLGNQSSASRHVRICGRGQIGKETGRVGGGRQTHR